MNRTLHVMRATHTSPFGFFVFDGRDQIAHCRGMALLYAFLAKQPQKGDIALTFDPAVADFVRTTALESVA